MSKQPRSPVIRARNYRPGMYAQTAATDLRREREEKAKAERRKAARRPKEGAGR